MSKSKLGRAIATALTELAHARRELPYDTWRRAYTAALAAQASLRADQKDAATEKLDEALSILEGLSE